MCKFVQELRNSLLNVSQYLNRQIMKRLFFAVIAVLVSVAASAQEQDAFYEQCVKEIFALKDKWPTTTNWKGEKELTPFYEVKKDVQMQFAEEFMKTELYKAAKAQSDIVVGKMHQNDNKIIESRTITSMSFNAHIHEDEYTISLTKDFSTKKWKLEFTYNHSSYSTPPPVNLIDINIDGSQKLKGNTNQESYCVIASIAIYRYSGKNGLEISDSSAQSTRYSDNNGDLGKISAWDL